MIVPDFNGNSSCSWQNTLLLLGGISRINPLGTMNISIKMWPPVAFITCCWPSTAPCVTIINLCHKWFKFTITTESNVTFQFPYSRAKSLGSVSVLKLLSPILSALCGVLYVIVVQQFRVCIQLKMLIITPESLIGTSHKWQELHWKYKISKNIYECNMCAIFPLRCGYCT